MAINWTDEQLEAITAKGSNILVAAAAGSGKTAVLVERIIRMITDDENPVSVDNLLVLTFTEAAASEMRRKIADAIDKKLTEYPDSAWLKEQSIRVGSASISTIHAFCNRIISNNVHLTNLPSDFSLIDETENQVLRANALDTVLESYYSRIDKKPAFRELVHGWGGIKGDDALREIVLKLHDFSRSLAYPSKWLHKSWANTYRKIEKGIPFEETDWAELFSQELFSTAFGIAKGLRVILDIVEKEVPTDHAYYSFYYDLATSYFNGFNKLFECDPADFTNTLTELLTSFEIRTAPRKNGLDETTVTRINNVRDKVVKTEKKKGEKLLRATNPEELGRMTKCAPVIHTLCNIVRLTERVHQKYKRDRNAIDFSDLEHGLLHLLINNKGEETPLCRRLRNHYHEILLDEFQDTNILQFEIFSKLSKAQGNLFMVGDVKQCIYKFRNADPSIFLRLYKAYGNQQGGKLIRLFKNFRSRKEVIDSVNFIFSSIMNEHLGGVDYTETEYLRQGAAYPRGKGFTTEMLITDTTLPTNVDASEYEASDLEALTVAQRIRDLVCFDNFTVTDKESGELRPVRYSDITVLCRGYKECAVIDEALSRIGIATISDTGIQYLESVEVNTVLSFLTIIDNPLQDIPLIAVMRSPMFRFSADELAEIRACAKGRYYTALCAAAKENPKAADFLDILLDLRGCAKYMGTDELVWKILNELNYFSIVGAMPNGELRKSNLKLLLERCSDFEQGSLTGLFNFIKYIEMLKENDKDLAPANELSSGTDAVRIMTMHKSKGLEFPVTVIFGTSKKFFLGDIQRNIIWDEKYGIGLDYVDTRQRVRFHNPMRKMLEGQLLNSLKSEEMRLLYVAMTRAKEKLIMSASISSIDNKWMDAEFNEEGVLYPMFSDMVMRMRDWLLFALMNNAGASELRRYADRTDIVPRIDNDAEFDVKILYPYKDGIVAEDETAAEDETYENTGDISERLDFVYPYSELSSLSVKLSISELKRRRMPEEDFSRGLIRNPVTISEESDGFDAAEKGTITHFVLQHLDLKNCETEDKILAQIEAMVDSGMITKQQKEAVNTATITSFFMSDLGTRLRNAEKIEREFDFYMLVPPSELDSSIKSEYADDIILQGIADCFFYDGDGIVLIDYKTDRVGKDGATKRSERYRVQIDYYAKGLSEILGLPVKEKYLYFLNCLEAVAM